MEIIFILLVILGIITALGHALWLALAALFRALFGRGRAPDILPAGCAVCGASVRASDEFCTHCGSRQQPHAEPHPLAELTMATRQLDRFLQQGKLDAATHARVMSAIADEHARLSEATGVATAQPSDEAAPISRTSALPQPSDFSSTSVERAATGLPPMPPTTIVTPIASPPRRSLAAFMEERSIQWGELVGGLLIVGCSIALVVSLWAQITAVPLRKYAVFVGLTAGLFGLGFYSAHRWRLPTTSRAVLIIATLLVPLNFLAMTAFSQQRATASGLALGGELLALVLFAALVYQAARVLTPGRALLLIGATLGPSCAMLLARHWTAAPAAIPLLGIAPMICYWLAAGALLRTGPANVRQAASLSQTSSAGQRTETTTSWQLVGHISEQDDGEETSRVFTLFGIAAFAALLPLGLLFVRAGDWPQATHQFAWLVSLFGVPAIFVGLAVWRRINHATTHRGVLQTSATSLALIGALLALIGLLLAWPNVPLLIVIASLNGLICLLTAWRFGLPWAHAGAIAHLLLAYLIGCNLLTGKIAVHNEDGRRLLASLLSMTSGAALLPVFILLALVAELWRRAARNIEGTLYAVAALVTGALSLLLATLHGFGRAGDPQRLALIYAFYAAAAFVIAWRRETRAASWLGTGLALLATVQAVVFGYGGALAAHHPLRWSLLIYAGVAALTALLLSRRAAKAQRLFSAPLLVSALTLPAVVIIGQWLSQWLSATRFDEAWPLSWVVLALNAALFIVIGRAGEIARAARGLYLTGLLIIGRALLLGPHNSHPLLGWPQSGNSLLSRTVIAISLYAGLTSWLWHKRALWRPMIERWHLLPGDAAATRAQAWLIVANYLATALVTFGNFNIVFSAEVLAQRLIVTTVAFALPLAFILLANGARDQRLIMAGLRVAVLDAVLWGWAWLDPRGDERVGGNGSERLVIVMIIALGIVIAYRLLAGSYLRAESRWRQPLRAQLSWIAVTGLAALGGVLSMELHSYLDWGASLMTWPVIAAVLTTLLSLIVTSLALALLPGEDPFAWDEHRKTRYVYAAECFVVLTLLHLRLTMPWLFTGFFSTYWPLIVMAVAFAGVAVSELLRRQGRLVLAEPLEKTGALLPLLPIFGFWLIRPPLSYSALLLLVGLFYGVLSVMRSSFAFGLLAALAGNAGLWHFLSGHAGYGFFEHPQLWLIPAALSVLVAAHLNRARLSVEQMTTIRYAALIVIYVSSTADIFINGVLTAPWLPIVLALLAVSGVLTGLLLRIRAFLFLGTAFLSLALLTMIWSAAVNLGWEWLWYVSGIAIGVLIIYTFAMFERKRAELLSLVERLKQWQ